MPSTRCQWGITLGLAILTGVALLGVMRLTIDPSNERLFLRHSDAYRVYQRFLASFGSDETILVALHDPMHSMLLPAGLAAVRALTQALKDTSHVSSVSSLTNARDMARLSITPFGIAAPRLIAGQELSAAQIAAIRTNDLLIGTLLSADLHTAGLLVVPEGTIAAPHVRREWIAAVRLVAAQHAMHGRKTYVAGTPLERNDVTYYLRRDQQLMVPLVFLLLLGITYRIYRVKRLACIPLGCVLLSLTWTMGIVGFAGIPLNLVTSLLPPVIMVVSVSAAIHLINQFITARESGAYGPAAVQQAMRQVGMACWLTSLTTTMGFFSLLVSPVPAIREFAFFAGLGVLLAFGVTMTFVPLALLWSGHMPLERFAHLKQGCIERLLAWLIGWVAAHRRKIMAGTLLILAVLLAGIWHLREGTDIVRALKKHAPLRVSTEFIDRHLTGVNSLELMVRLPDTAKSFDPTFIRQVLAFSQWLRAQSGVTAVHSPWEPLRGVRADLRAHDEQLSVLATLIPFALPLQTWLDVNAKTLRISARVLAMNSDRFLELAQGIEHQAAQQHLPAQITGNNYLLAQMSRSLVHTQIRSLGLAVVLILGTITLALRTWKLGLIAAIPNVIPPVMIFGLMGWCGIALSTATTMIASVALGLIVDDTIHLLYRYRHEKLAGKTISQALEQAVRHTGRALIFTTIILTLGFWVGLVGSFKPTLSFSFLTGLTMVFALLADLFVVPAILLTWDRS